MKARKKNPSACRVPERFIDQKLSRLLAAARFEYLAKGGKPLSLEEINAELHGSAPARRRKARRAS